jgi:hypothetical protein
MERPARGERHRSSAAVTQTNSGRLGNLYGRGRLPGRRRCGEPDISAAASEGTAGVDCSLDLTNALVIPHPDVPPWRQRRVVVPDRIRGSSPSASVRSRRAPPASLGPTASAVVHCLFLSPQSCAGPRRWRDQPYVILCIRHVSPLLLTTMNLPIKKTVRSIKQSSHVHSPFRIASTLLS